MKECRSALLCGIVTVIFILAPSVISADETVPEVTLVAEHGGFVVSDANSESFSIIDGSLLPSVSAEWNIGFPIMWPSETGAERIAIGIMPGTFGNPVFPRVLGTNFSFIHTALSPSVSTTTISIPAPLLGSPEMSAGVYTLFVQELPETKFVCEDVEPFECLDVPYTDQDFIDFMTVDPNQPDAPFTYPPLGGRSLAFEYVAGGEVQAVPPTLSSLGQFKLLGVDAIAEGGTFIGNEAVFKGVVADTDSTQVKLEVELKPVDAPFDGSGTVASNLAAPGEFSLAFDELISVAQHYLPGGNQKSFHWRARAVDGEGNASEWQEFGIAGNTDFTAKVVPLWTQKISPFPSETTTSDWAGEDYANGVANVPGDCGLTISQCGCAITSAIMVAQYFGVQTSADGASIDPLRLNNWLLEHSAAYVHDGSFAWSPMEDYTGGKLKYRGDKRFDIPHNPNYQNTPADFALLDEYVTRESDPIPVIAKSAHFKNRGGIRRTHFFVVDSKVASTYGVRDPYWFETKTLNDPTSVPQLVRRYEGGFDGLRVYEPNDTVAYTPYMTHSLGSPAELLFTDSSGRKLGKDPRTGQIFNDIPGGSYFEDDRISNPDENVPDVVPRESNKVLEIANPPEGDYTLEVIGTGMGSFSLTSSFTDSAGGSSGESLNGSTAPSAVSLYQGTFEPTNSEVSDIEEKKTPLQVFAELKTAVNAVTIKPPLLKATIKATVVVAEELYKKGRIPLAKLTLKGLEELIKSKKGKGVTPADADNFLRLIRDLQASLKV